MSCILESINSRIQKVLTARDTVVPDLLLLTLYSRYISPIGSLAVARASVVIFRCQSTSKVILPHCSNFNLSKMFGQPAAQEKDLELPLPAGADTIQALDWNPMGNMLAGGGWDNKARCGEGQRPRLSDHT